MNTSDITSLSSPECRAFIEDHLHDDPVELAFRSRSLSNSIPVRACIEQIVCRRKSERKLPFLCRTDFLFDATALEQCSGQQTAQYKASCLSGTSAIDLAAGLGIDTIFLSRSFSQVHACEANPLLAELLVHNLKALGIENVQVHQGDGLAVLAQFPDDTFDWIYADPSRRDANRRYVDLRDASPSLPEAEEVLLNKAARVCIKASPAYDLTAACKVFSNLVRAEAVSVDGECKELLLFLERLSSDPVPVRRKATVLSGDSGRITVADSDGSEDRSEVSGRYPAPNQVLLEPDAAIVKIGLTGELGRRYGATRLSDHIDFLIASTRPEEFPGRAFEVIAVLRWNRKRVKAYLQDQGITAASVTRRDFPLSPEQFRKDFRLAQDPEVFLITTRVQGNPVVIHARRMG